MIKIQIANVIIKEQEYIDAVLNDVANRVNILKKSVGHLRNEVIDIDRDDFVSLKAITRKIINEIENRIDGEAIYSKQNYSATIQKYLANPNTLINLDGVNGLLNSLVANDNDLLKHLLKCKPENLYNLNNEILNNNGISTTIEMFILKLAFSYQDYPEIANKIKAFFRDNNFVNYCPYCNAEETEFTKTLMGQAVHSHQLDHFFNKATHPLLSYSMYNLIPSDATCNATNKDQIQFSDEYYLNPYIEGFGNSMNFFPHINGTNFEVLKISVQINELAKSNKFKQLIGNNNDVNEDDNLGNINVFKLQSKHNKTETIRRARKILKDINKTYGGLSAIKKFTDLLGPLNNKDNYLRWYDENICTPFKYNEFNNGRYSKFNRDIHDYYFKLNKKTRNNYVRQLIAENLS